MQYLMVWWEGTYVWWDGKEIGSSFGEGNVPPNAIFQKARSMSVWWYCPLHHRLEGKELSSPHLFMALRSSRDCEELESAERVGYTRWGKSILKWLAGERDRPPRILLAWIRENADSKATAIVLKRIKERMPRTYYLRALASAL